MARHTLIPRPGARAFTVTLPLLAVLLLGGCKAEDVVPPKTTLKPDVARVTPRAPILTENPTRTPLLTIALRGKADGERVVVHGGTRPATATPLPSGDFCVDVPIVPGKTTMLAVSTLENGLISPATKHTVTQDSNAPKPSQPYCEKPECDASCPVETACGNQQDDDSDGWTDFCDLDCSKCTDDAYEPNDLAANVPVMLPGTYSNLKLCPCHSDWYAFIAASGKTINVEVSFDTSAIDIDMKLFRASDAESGGYKTSTPLQSSLTTGSPESINWTADKLDTYYLYVHPHNEEKKAGTYSMTVK